MKPEDDKPKAKASPYCRHRVISWMCRECNPSLDTGGVAFVRTGEHPYREEKQEKPKPVQRSKVPEHKQIVNSKKNSGFRKNQPKKKAVPPKDIPVSPKLKQWPDGVRKYPDGREVYLDPKKYRANTLLCRRRQNCTCCICGKWLAEDEATLEHENLRSGGHRDDRAYLRDERGRLRRNNGAAHATCNCVKGSRRFPLLQPKYQKNRSDTV